MIATHHLILHSGPDGSGPSKVSAPESRSFASSLSSLDLRTRIEAARRNKADFSNNATHRAARS